MAKITLLKPLKKASPWVLFSMAINSSKLAPAQKALLPVDLSMITEQSSAVPARLMQFAISDKSCPGRELLAGCSNEIVPTPSDVSNTTFPELVILLRFNHVN
jgi:hypothetical protein